MCLLDYNIDNNWREFFEEECKKPYYKSLMSFVEKEYMNHTVYPAREHIYRAFELTDPDDITLVIIGQDPYHEPGQATGLAFAVSDGIKTPPSLRNIYKEIEVELGISLAGNLDYSLINRLGVLLLNSVLTVREGEPNSHKNMGWEIFTDAAIKYLDATKRPICYMLWGNYARTKESLITNTSSLVLSAAHPSPLSATRGFYGCNHFIQYMDFLQKNYNISLNGIENVL